MKVSLLLGALFLFVILPSRAQETHFVSGKDSSAVEFRFFLATIGFAVTLILCRAYPQ